MIDKALIINAESLVSKGKYTDAEKIYNELLEEEPENHILLSALGLFYIRLKNYEKAKTYLKKACEINRTFGTISALGFAEYETGNYDTAAIILEQSLELGENIDVYDKLIMSLLSNHEYNAAKKYADIMYEKYPNVASAVANKVRTLTETGDFIEAEKICVEYLKEHNNEASLWTLLGLLKEVIYSDDEQACQCFNVAADLGAPEAYYHMAVSYQKQGDYENAEKTYKKLLNVFPDDTETKASYGTCLLKQKKFKEGYELFFDRDKNSLDSITNKWLPGKNFEKEVVVISDQGFGDNIQFVRYLPFLRDKTDKIFVTVRKALRELFQRNYPYIKFIDFEEMNPNMQAVRITDLAYALDMDFENIPFSEGYLKAPIANIKSDMPKVGLCWEAGSSDIRILVHRTINVKTLEPLFDLNKIQLYSFQVYDTMGGNDKYPQMINIAHDFRNFEDTAEAINAMDLIITVDTAVAHLAGALGKKTWLLLPYVTDWRWFNDNKTTPWYDSVEIFKQRDPISWEEPIEEILCRLKEYCL